MARKEDEEEKVIVCLRADQPPGTPARVHTCQRCLQPVWVSPETLIAAGADATIICTGCLDDHIAEAPPGEPIEFVPPTQAQNEAVRRARGGSGD